VTKDVGQIRDATIHGRPISDSLMNADMEESHTLQIINFFPLCYTKEPILLAFTC